MVTRAEKSHAFTDGLSRRDALDVTPERDPFMVEFDPAEPPSTWTAEHVAARMVAAFETLLALGVSVGPRQHANGWPAMLQEFSDLVDEEAMANARQAFAKARRRPSADDISMMDEALAWPIRYARDAPMLCDAILLWAFCKASGASIAGALRARVARAKAIAEVQEAAENERRKDELEHVRADILRWAQRLAEERRLSERTGEDRIEGVARIKAAALARQDEAAERLRPISVLPHDAMPEKVLSRATLDRMLPRATTLIAGRLEAARVPVR
jgi:hypothetical protein